jgi:hypothetical protein
MFDAITLSTDDIDFLKLRTAGGSADLRDKYVEITAHRLLGDAGKLSFNFISALDFFILLQKTQIANFDGSKYLFSIFCGPNIIFSPTSGISTVDSVIASNIQEIVESAKLKRSKEALTVMNKYLFSIFCGPKIIFSPTSGQIIHFRL